MRWSSSWHSDGRLVAVPGADADDAVDRRDPDLAVPDPARLGGRDDRLSDRLDVGVVEHDLEPDLGHQRDVVLRAPVDLGVTLLPAVTADLAHGHPGDADTLERGADFLPLVRLDHRGHDLHVVILSVSGPGPGERPGCRLRRVEAGSGARAGR